jgi:Double zinc ribbon
MTVEVTCPTCGTDSYFDELNRDSAAFCRVCDYPLFWALAPRLGAAEDEGDTGLRRLPGTAGRVAIATLACPVCTEPNPLGGSVCIRCGADLHPAPATALVQELPPPPLPPPPPPPPPPKRVLWPWILLGVSALVALGLLLFFLLG